jgi:uncharacterized OsmC-like protein
MSERAQRIEVSLVEGARMVAKIGDFTVDIDFDEKLGGKGSAPSPTELFVTSIAACKLLYAYRFLLRRDVSTDGAKATVTWESSRTAVESAKVHVAIPGGIDPALREGCLDMMSKCFVARSVQSNMAIETSVD